MNTVALVFLLWASLQPTLQDPAPAAWSTQQRATAVDGCRSIIMANATRDYLLRNNLREDQLPADFAKKAMPAAEPWLAICDCMIHEVAADTSLVEFNANAEALQARIQALVSDGGRCAPGTGARQQR